MAAKFSTPGVYVQEVPNLPPAVTEVPTAIPAFIGYTEKTAREPSGDLIRTAVKISSFKEFEQVFGGPAPVTVDHISIHIKDSGGHVFDINVVPREGKEPAYNLYYAVRHFYDNGGSTCYIIAADTYESRVVDGEALLAGLEVAAGVDEVTLLSVPEAAAGQGIHAGQGYTAVVDGMIRQASSLRDRMALIDPFRVTRVNAGTPGDDTEADIQLIRDAARSVAENRYAAAYYPNLVTSYPPLYDLAAMTLAYEVETGREKSEPTYTDGMAMQAIGADSVLFSRIQETLGRERVVLPPSPAVAGVCTRVDNERGVWKAPANERLHAVDAPEVNITDQQQEGMNVDPGSGKSVNAIRAFSGRGIRVWGARTLAGNDNEWRYVSIRRFFNMVEESIKKSLHWAASAPNDPATWLKIRAMIENYLTLKWRAGALVGTRPEEAYFVRIGLGTTMTEKDVREGRMRVEIGLAPVRPREFIIINMVQLTEQPDAGGI